MSSLNNYEDSHLTFHPCKLKIRVISIHSDIAVLNLETIKISTKTNVYRFYSWNNFLSDLNTADVDCF